MPLLFHLLHSCGPCFPGARINSLRNHHTYHTYLDLPSTILSTHKPTECWPSLLPSYLVLRTEPSPRKVATALNDKDCCASCGLTLKQKQLPECAVSRTQDSGPQVPHRQPITQLYPKEEPEDLEAVVRPCATQCHSYNCWLWWQHH